MHTKGPWKIEPATSGYRAPCDDDANDVAIIAPDGLSIGVLWDGVIGPLKDTQDANARLIAAAPDLLEALRDMVSDRDCLSEATIEFARKAIAKATT